MAQELSMTLTRALAELKSIEGRFAAAVDSSMFVSIAIGQGERKRPGVAHLASQSVDEIATRIKSSYQSVSDLLSLHAAIKSSLLIANATTNVTIAGETMTIAEAIERKRSIKMHEHLLEKMRVQHMRVAGDFDTLTTRMNQGIDQAQTSVFGGDKSKANAEELDAIRRSRLKEFEPSIIDPLSILTLIDEKMKAIQSFKTEVDFALSEVNAKTTITVSV